MKANQITALATSVIAISVIGYISFDIYDDPKNKVERCWATYLRATKNGIPKYYKDDYLKNGGTVESYERSEAILYKRCKEKATRGLLK